MRQRIQQLLDRLRDREQTPDGLRIIRAVEVLEKAGGPAAHKVLEELAHGPAAALATREAAEAVKRSPGDFV
jgi:hypothetical protein